MATNCSWEKEKRGEVHCREVDVFFYIQRRREDRLYFIKNMYH